MSNLELDQLKLLLAAADTPLTIFIFLHFSKRLDDHLTHLLRIHESILQESLRKDL